MPGTANDLSGRVGLDTTDFKTGLAAMNRELRVLESGFRASAAGLGDWSKDASGLEMRIKSLNSQMEVQKNKVDLLSAEYKRVAAEQGENSRAAQDLQIKLNKETETLGRMGAELKLAETELVDVEKETTDLSKAEEKTTSSTKKFAGALGSLKDKLTAGVKGLGGMAVGVAKLGAKMAVGLVAGAAAATAGIGALVVKTAAASDELVETAEKLGITTTKLQEMNYIADQTGTGVESVQTALARVIRNLDDVEKAGSPANLAFSQLGISIRDANGQMLDTETIFFSALEALGQVGNETERDALAMEIFGKSALELNPLINLGAEGLANMSAEAHAMGAVMGEDAVTGMADLNDALAGLKGGFTGMAGTLATAFLPTITTMVDYIKSTVVPWIQEKLPIAIEKLKKYWVEVLQPAIEQVWKWMSTVLIPFLKDVVFPWLQENVPKALKFLSDVWTNVLKPAIETVWKWMSTVLIPFLRDTVFPWLKEHVPAAIQTLSDFWTNTLKPAIETVWNWMSTVLIPFLRDTVFPWLQEKIPAAIQTLSDFWTETLKPAIETVWDFIDKYILPILSTLKDIFEIGLKLAIETIAGVWTNVLLPALEDVHDFIETYITPAFTWLKDNVIVPLGAALSGGLKEALQWVYDKLVLLKGVFATIKIPDWLTPGSPTPLELGIRGITDAVHELNRMELPRLSVGLGRLSPVNAGQQSQRSVQNSWSYTIQAATPLQTSNELIRQMRLLELMHGSST